MGAEPQHPQQPQEAQQNAYHIDIVALPPPQQGMLMAPTILQGTPIDQNNSKLAKGDVDLMEGMHRKGQATQDQVSLAQQRHFNVQLCHAPGMANIGVGVVAAIQNIQNTIQNMQNTIQNMQNTIQNMQNTMQNMQNNMNQRFNAVDQRLDGMDQRFDSMDARLENMGRRTMNLTSNSQLGANAQLIPLLKERPGLGPVLPGPFEPIVIDGPLVQVGNPVQQYFPLNIGEMPSLSHAQINFLSQMYNNSFRIVGTDAIEARQKKFEDFAMRG